MNPELNYPKNQRYLVAVSGGPDSMALLDLLYKHQFNIVVAHVNYKKRIESDEEESMVKQYCRIKQIPIYATTYQDSNEKKSFQVKARNFRYHFFKSIYYQNNCQGLFVAHQKDDLIETYLLKKQRNVINQSYLILGETTILDMTVYRPLLNYYKKELEEYCKQHQVPYRIDKSNYSMIYPRNKIRHDLLMEDKEKIYQEAMMNEKKLNQVQEEVKKYINENTSYLIKDLKNKDDLFLQIFLHQTINSKYQLKINKNILSKLKNFLWSKKPNLKHKIEKEYYLIKAYDKIYFDELVTKDSYCYVLEKIEWLTTPYFKTQETGEKKQGIWLNKEDFPIKIRNAKPNDYISIKNGTKKINRLFIDKKIPKEERKIKPIIENKDGVIVFVSEIYRKKSFNTTQNNFFVIEYNKVK